MTKPLPTLSDAEVRRLQTVLETDREAGFGALTTERGPLPLKALDVQTRIDGLLARTEISQTFVNTHDQPLEATYIFPLPDRAAVTRFRLEVAGRVVEGELKERGQARKEYDQAIKEGHRAAITEEERPGVFTMRVGNLPAGEAATVRLTLTGPLPVSDGEAAFRFPLVVAPRYIPGAPLPGPQVGAGIAPDTDAVPDASRISPPVLLPGFPNPVRLSLAVEFAPSALAPTDLRSSLHAVTEEGEMGRGQETTPQRGGFRRVVLQPGERLDRDFILRFHLGREGEAPAEPWAPGSAGASPSRVSDGQLGTSLQFMPDADQVEGTFALTLVPPRLSAGKGRPRDVVFVLDRSGSMGGWKMVAARRAMARMVETLTDTDRFTVLAFDDVIETPPSFSGTALEPATAARRTRAVEFLGNIDARGGTEMAQPLEVGVTELTRETAGSGDPRRAGRERILVLVTDGQVGNEDQILRELGKRLRGVRVFTLGVDQAVNAAFLKRLADLGGGASALVESEVRLDEVMDQVHRKIGTPVLTALKLEAFRMEIVPGSVVPARLPDVFEATPVVILGRYRKMQSVGLAMNPPVAWGGIKIQARAADGEMWTQQVQVDPEPAQALATVWARGRLRDLEDRYVTGGADLEALEKEIVGVSLKFGVLCRFTSFVAVDRSAVVNEGGKVHGIVQPVEQPAGWVARGAFTGAVSACLAAPMATGAEYELGSVDSMLMDFDEAEASGTIAPQKKRKALPPSARSARPPSPPRPGAAPSKSNKGLLGKIKDFFSGKKEDTAKESGPPEAKPDDLRLRLGEMLGAMRGIDPSALSHLALLRSRFDDLEALTKAVAEAGVRSQEATALAEAVAAAEVLLMTPTPDEAAVEEVWGRLEKALQECLDEWEASRSGRPRRFWA
jgi:Ca-activated chloride channel family protein